MINNLDFDYEINTWADGTEDYKFTYKIDGKKLIFDGYIPVRFYQIVNEDFLDYVYLSVCSCGNEGCGSVVANVKVEGTIVKWECCRLYDEENVLQVFCFEKSKYLQKIQEIKKLAQKAKEIIEKRNKNSPVS